MRRLVLFLSVLAFFVNPGFACSSGEGDFSFGETEMRSAVEGTWQITLGGDAATSEVTVQIRQSRDKVDGRMAAGPGARSRGLIRPASACDNRTFVGSASACMDVSSMPLDVSYVAGNPAYQGMTMGGNLRVYGTSFSRGYLEIALGGVGVSAEVTPSGAASPLNGTAVSLVRLGP